MPQNKMMLVHYFFTKEQISQIIGKGEKQMNERIGTISIQRSLKYVGLDMVAVGSLKDGYVITRQQYVKVWLTPYHKFSQHDMALMLIEILRERKMLNEATYRKIQMKYGGKK